MRIVAMSAPKREPTVHAVDPGGASQIGLAQATRMATVPLYEGHGYQAPVGGGTTIHEGGSQGKHK